MCLNPGKLYFPPLAFGFHRWYIENIGKYTRNTAMNETWEVISAICNYRLFTIKGHVLTVEELVVAAIVFFIGLFAAYITRKHIQQALAKKTRLSEHNVIMVSQIVRYSIIVLTIFIVLDIIHIPLASFAFLGGCLAVGIGFGIKNLINNLLSGFVLMGERPIKIGDVVEIEGTTGIVEEIGLRCTKIRTGENLHIIFPNSKLMDEKLVNWSYHNRKILGRVDVGIAYGSDVEKASALMLEAAGKTEAVLPDPKPFVQFNDFGDSSLVFHIYFALHVHNQMERWSAESQVRYAVNKALNAAGIVIAFPQRDVHFNTDTPIPITVRNPETDGK